MLKKMFKKIKGAKNPNVESVAFTEYDFIGKNVLIRAYMMGVQVGTVKSVKGDFLELINTRKLWAWCPKKGIALESLVENGVDINRTRATAITHSVFIQKNDCVGIITLNQPIYEEIMGLLESEQD